MVLFVLLLSFSVNAVSAPENPYETSPMTLVITSATAYRPDMANDVLSEKDEENPNARLRKIFNFALATKYKSENENDTRALIFDQDEGIKGAKRAFLTFRKEKGGDEWKTKTNQLVSRLKDWKIPLSENGAFLGDLGDLHDDFFRPDVINGPVRWFRAPLSEVVTMNALSVLHSVLIEWGDKEFMKEYVESLSIEPRKNEEELELTEDEAQKHIRNRISSIIYDRHFQTIPIKLLKYKYSASEPKGANQTPLALNGLYLVKHRGAQYDEEIPNKGYLAFIKPEEKDKTYFIELERLKIEENHIDIKLYGNCFTSILVAPFIGEQNLSCRQCDRCHLVPNSTKAGKGAYFYSFNIWTDGDDDKYPNYFSLSRDVPKENYAIRITRDKKSNIPKFGRNEVVVLRPSKTDTGAPICTKKVFSGVPLFSFEGK